MSNGLAPMLNLRDAIARAVAAQTAMMDVPAGKKLYAVVNFDEDKSIHVGVVTRVGDHVEIGGMANLSPERKWSGQIQFAVDD